MFVTKQIESEHKDLIHDVSFDFYGKRMASCSSDQSVKVRFLKINDLELIIVALMGLFLFMFY